jgi:tRNA (cmo5U34)-methyltransferase
VSFLSKIIKLRQPSKWSAARIQSRFEAAAHVFAKLTEGQAEIIDAKMMRDLIVSAAIKSTPNAKTAIDVGCGGGFYAAGLLEALPSLDLLITDISRPMLDSAAKNLAPLCSNEIVGMHGDIRNVRLDKNSCDIITAAAVLHHLRDESEWIDVFTKFYSALRPNGSLWIADIVAFENKAVQQLADERYVEYLTELYNRQRAKKMMRFIELEDSPRPLSFQLGLLKHVGFSTVDVLHANTNFAAFGAVKS